MKRIVCFLIVGAHWQAPDEVKTREVRQRLESVDRCPELGFG